MIPANKNMVLPQIAKRGFTVEVGCPDCHKLYDIPDERLPIGKKIAFPCPNCKGTIELDLRSKSAPSIPFAQKQPTGEALKKRILQSVRDLPPMPQTIHRAREIMANPTSSFKELAKVLETDQAVSFKVLRMANSAYYGVSGKVSTIQHAAVILGHRTLGEIITVAGTSDLLGDTLEGYDLEAGDLWRHSLAVAFGSRIIANKKNPELADDAFSAGIIHDAGKLILDKYILERKEAFEEFMTDGQETFLSAEKQILGFDHSELASELCKSWHIPKALSIAIRYHHYPSHSQGSELAYIVHMADVIAMTTGMGTGIDGTMYQIEDTAMEFLGLRDKDTSIIMAEVVESVTRIAEGM